MGNSLEIRESEEGLLLPIQAKPKASRNALLGIHAGRLKVAVTATPEKGRANAAILDLLADRLGLKKSQVSLESGGTSTLKKALVRGISLEELRERIRVRSGRG